MKVEQQHGQDQQQKGRENDPPGVQVLLALAQQVAQWWDPTPARPDRENRAKVSATMAPLMRDQVKM